MSSECWLTLYAPVIEQVEGLGALGAAHQVEGVGGDGQLVHIRDLCQVLLQVIFATLDGLRLTDLCLLQSHTHTQGQLYSK